MRVLLIEDDLVDTKRARRELESRGLTVSSVRTLDRARQFLCSSPAVDVVVLDMSLCGLQGRDVFHFVRRSWDGPLVVYTGSIEDHLGAELLSLPELPAAAWVTKDVGMWFLSSAVLDAGSGVCIGLATRVEEDRLRRATGSFMAILQEPWP